MKRAFAVLGSFVLLIAVVMGLGTALFVGFGALLARWLPLSLFQASALAIGATIAFAATLYALSTIRHANASYDLDEDFEEEDVEEKDDFSPNGSHLDSSFPNPDFSKVSRNDYCPCGSGRKFKNCCENTTVR